MRKNEIDKVKTMSGIFRQRILFWGNEMKEHVEAAENASDGEDRQEAIERYREVEARKMECEYLYSVLLDEFPWAKNFELD